MAEEASVVAISSPSSKDSVPLLMEGIYLEEVPPATVETREVYMVSTKDEVYYIYYIYIFRALYCMHYILACLKVSISTSYKLSML